jgi:hypothetical protein
MTCLLSLVASSCVTATIVHLIVDHAHPEAPVPVLAQAVPYSRA